MFSFFDINLEKTNIDWNLFSFFKYIFIWVVYSENNWILQKGGWGTIKRENCCNIYYMGLLYMYCLVLKREKRIWFCDALWNKNWGSGLRHRWKIDLVFSYTKRKPKEAINCWINKWVWNVTTCVRQRVSIEEVNWGSASNVGLAIEAKICKLPLQA